MVREPSRELVEVARAFVCVRVTDMSEVDLDVYRFDYDLCTGCGTCERQCPVHAIEMITEPWPGAPASSGGEG